MIKRHFFLIAAAALLVLMVVAAIVRITFASSGPEGAGGPGGGARRGQQVSQVEVTQRPFSDQIRVLGVARGARSVNITVALPVSGSTRSMSSRVCARFSRCTSSADPSGSQSTRAT